MNRLWWILPLLAGAALRFWGLDFGAPLASNLYIRPDESLVIVSGVEFFRHAGTPGTYAYPALFQQMAALLSHLISSNPAHAFGLDPSPFYLAVRALAALFGTATILLVYAIARGFVNQPWASLAALLYAVSPLAARDAHFAVTDIPSVFFQTAVVWFALLYIDAIPARARRYFWLAALALALSMSTKYAGLLLLSVLLSAAFIRARERSEALPWPLLAQSLTAIALLFTALNPYLFLNWAKAWEEIWSIVEALFFWQPGDPVWNLSHALWQVVKPLRHGSGGWLGLAAGLAAIVWATRRRDSRLLLVAQPVLSTFLVLLPFQHTVPYRYLLPALPALAVLVIVLTQRISSRAPLAAAAAALALLVAPQAVTAARFVHLLGLEDTRSLAGAWVRAKVPQSTPIVWLGGPECEPQFFDSPASVGRRIDFAFRRYGPVSGAIVSAPYILMKDAREKEHRSGWEIFRNPPAAEFPAGEILLITPRYPLRMANFKLPVPPGSLQPIAAPQDFPSLQDGVWDGLELDLIDAWFLPFRPLDGVLRPGPGLRIQKMLYRPSPKQ
jgi:4-amino-4-deoxy-L-arabinose transferase-like glycosyltransferase